MSGEANLLAAAQALQNTNDRIYREQEQMLQYLRSELNELKERYKQLLEEVQHATEEVRLA